MARTTGGIADRADVNTLNSVSPKYTEEPLTRCVPRSDFEGDINYIIDGTYEQNQLVKFEDITWHFVPEPEPEPVYSVGELESVEAVLISNTGKPGSQYLAENGSGVLTLEFKVRIRAENGTVYPLGNSWFQPVNIINIQSYDDTYFSAWTISNGNRLCIAPKQSNTGQDEKSVNLVLDFYQMISYVGPVYDSFGYTAKQVGITHGVVPKNMRVKYFNENNQETVQSYIWANGANHAKIFCDIDTTLGKTDQTAVTITNTYTNILGTPYYDSSSPNTDCFTIDRENNKITGQHLGTTTVPSRSAYVYGTFPFSGRTYMVESPQYVLVTQSANYMTTTETTYHFTADTYAESIYIPNEGTGEPEDKDYIEQQGETYTGRIIHANEFTAYRDFDRYTGYLSGSCGRTMSYEEHVTCDTLETIDGQTPSGVYVDQQVLTSIPDPFLKVPYNSGAQRDIPIKVGWTGGTNETGNITSDTFTFIQYGAQVNIRVTAIQSVWVKPGSDFPHDDPGRGDDSGGPLYVIPANLYGRTYERLVTADCVTLWTSTTNGVTTTGSDPYDPINMGDGAYNSKVKANLINTDVSGHFALYIDNDQNPYQYVSMPYTDFNPMGDDGQICHHVWVAPVSANTSGYDIEATLQIEYGSNYAGGVWEDMQSITIRHEHA